MPDTRTHRGPHPEDTRLFAMSEWPRLRDATADLCWLLNRGYAAASSLKLVGDRHELVARQRTAVGRCAAGDTDVARRKAHCIDVEFPSGRALWLDGYNVLTTVEAALAGGVILVGRDGCYRDMASMHGSYRKVAETRPALELIGQATAEMGVGECVWLLDRPVSNSGRLKQIIGEVAAAHGWHWSVELVADPDPILAQVDQVVATADSQILGSCRAWLNLARQVVASRVPDAIVDALG